MASERLLVVDDDPLIRGSLHEMLQGKGYDVEIASDGAEALDCLTRRSFDVVLADWKMPKVDGFSLLEQVRSLRPHAAVIIVTGFGTIDSAVEAMRRGATDFLTKPVQAFELQETIRRALENVKMSGKAGPDDPLGEVVGEHESIRQLLDTVRIVAANSATILLEGESGTGKRVIAHAIHRADPRRWDESFVEVSCGALPETLLESELFGHVRGAFTGAVRDKQGRFELANGGTILLDEIDTFSPNLQVKLLRVLQERTFERVGDSHPVKVDVRIIAATNRNLEELVKQGKFREDLYYRLNVIALRIPPLRERRSDIALLANHFLAKSCAETGRAVSAITDDALAVLSAYHWPGNVRELENAIQRAVILTKHSKITASDLPASYGHAPSATEPVAGARVASGVATTPLREAIRDPEREIILRVLQESGGNRSEAAKRLGIHRATLYRKLRQYDVEPKHAHSAPSVIQSA